MKHLSLISTGCSLLGLALLCFSDPLLAVIAFCASSAVAKTEVSLLNKRLARQSETNRRVLTGRS